VHEHLILIYLTCICTDTCVCTDTCMCTDTCDIRRKYGALDPPTYRLHDIPSSVRLALFTVSDFFAMCVCVGKFETQATRHPQQRAAFLVSISVCLYVCAWV